MLLLRLKPAGRSSSSSSTTKVASTRLPSLRCTSFRAFSASPFYCRERARSRDPQIGLSTPTSSSSHATNAHATHSPFYFAAGYAGWAKRPSRPFPPPFFSPPSGSFSDPLSTFGGKGAGGPKVNGQLIKGVTNGDDALLVSERFVGCDDGVGAWAQRERGHAPLWSRLVLHFWASRAEEDGYGGSESSAGGPNPVAWLEKAYRDTQQTLSEPNEWQGTTTACSALMHFAKGSGAGQERPMVYVTQLGDSKVMIIRPRERKILYETVEQWHYFDCPRQLGTNSPDTPEQNAVLGKVDVEVDDIVLAMTDGVTDNLWGDEITDCAVDSLDSWIERVKREGKADGQEEDGESGSLAEGMRFVARELVLAARKVAEDPFAASPFMERAVEEGLAIEGGKLDDISVVAALCRRRKG
jgi:protein phosphatase PTC7